MPETREHQLAHAFILIAVCDHYMVGLTEVVSVEELNDAEQILIVAQNKEKRADGGAYKAIDLALDMLEVHRRELTRDRK